MNLIIERTEDDDRIVYYYIKDNRAYPHREDGPALILKGIGTQWYKHSMLHREDGPAIEWSDGKNRGG